jgi:hypothetical protein
MGDELYLEPNRRAQIIVLLQFVVGALLLVSVYPIINYLTPSPRASLEELEAETRLLRLLTLGIVVIAFIISLFWVRYFGRLGYRALKLEIYPPPGTIVVRRTRVRTGKQAVLAGYLSISFAVLIGLFIAALIGYEIWFFTSAPFFEGRSEFSLVGITGSGTIFSLTTRKPMNSCESSMKNTRTQESWPNFDDEFQREWPVWGRITDV